MNKITLALLTMTAALLTVVPLAAGEEATLIASSGEGEAGESVSVPILLDGSDIEPTGVALGIAHDDEVLTLTGITMGAAVAALDEPDGPDFWVSNVDPTDGPGGFFAFVAVVGGVITPLPSEDGLELAVYEYDISDDAEADSSTDLDFTEELRAAPGAPPVAIEVVNGLEQTRLTLEAGEVGVVGGSVNILGDLSRLPFLRGDADGNGTVSGLRDGLFLLRFGFQEGKAPPCADAADADDNGTVNGLTDALRMLRWGFEEGPEPPAPGAETCDTDPTADDDLGCDVASPTCLD